MIIRKPGTVDIVKVANIICPEDPAYQADFTAVWLAKQKDPTFLGLVAVHKKKVLGFFVGHIRDTHLDITFFKGETTSILDSLWQRVVKTSEFDSAAVCTNDPMSFEKLGFTPTYSVMSYEAKPV